MRLVLEEGKTVGQVARDLDLTETALREWVNRARADRTQERTGLTTAEREELTRLRKENRELRVERDGDQLKELKRMAYRLDNRLAVKICGQLGIAPIR